MNAFDRFAPIYDSFMRIFRLDRTEKAAHFLSLKGTERVLDVGGGTGRLAEVLAEQASEVWLLDESAEMLKRASGMVRTVQGNALALPFDSSSFDVAILSDVLHHVKEQERLLAEIHRILKPGGTLLVQDFDNDYPQAKFFAFLEKIFFKETCFLSRKKLSILCRKSGFSFFEEAVGGFYFLIKWMKAMGGPPS